MSGLSFEVNNAGTFHEWFNKPTRAEHETHSILHPEQDRMKVLTRMNREWCETNISGKTIFVEKETGLMMGKLDFVNRFANEFLTYTTEDKNFMPVTKRASLSAEWLSWKHKVNARKGITFNPALMPGVTPCGYFNTWQGFAVQPVKNERLYDVFKTHVHDVIAGGDSVLAEYVLNWCAYGFQNPSKPVGVALVLRGIRGAGKGVFGNTLLSLWGKHSMHITSSNTLVGRFNSHLADKPFIFADEAMYAGDRKGEQVLKGLITETSMPVETKGYPVFMANTAFKILMATNSDYAVPAARDERRFCVVDVSDCKVGDVDYFKAFREALESDDGKAAVLWGLLNRDLSGVNIRLVPETQALKEQREFNLSVPAKFVVHFIQTGLNNPAQWNERVTSTALYDAYLKWANDEVRLGEYHRISQITLSKYLRRLDLKPYKSNTERGWMMGSLSSLISRFQTFEKVNLNELSLLDEFDDDELLAA